MNVLVVDVGGSHIKILVTGQKDRRELSSGPKLTAAKMAAKVKQLAADWQYDVVAIGYPGPVSNQRIAAEPHNLGKAWVGFDFAAAFGRPVKLINDAAMQALGGYRGGRMLFLGFGTGLGTAMIVGGLVEPMELGHLPYKKANTKATSANGRSTGWARRSGASTSSMSSSACAMRWCPTTCSSAAATSRISKNCRRAVGAATTPMRSPAASVGGRHRR